MWPGTWMYQQRCDGGPELKRKSFEVRNKSGFYHQLSNLNAGLLELQEQKSSMQLLLYYAPEAPQSLMYLQLFKGYHTVANGNGDAGHCHTARDYPAKRNLQLLKEKTKGRRGNWGIAGSVGLKQSQKPYCGWSGLGHRAFIFIFIFILQCSQGEILIIQLQNSFHRLDVSWLTGPMESILAWKRP